eukprot:SAG25_NODE_2866_length_1343_cov_0.946141_2_plen_341_part_00
MDAESAWYDTVWPALLALGWVHEKPGGGLNYYLPAGVVRGKAKPGGTSFQCRKDYFDSRRQVRAFLLRQKVAGQPVIDVPDSMLADAPPRGGGGGGSSPRQKRQRVAPAGADQQSSSAAQPTWLSRLKAGDQVDASDPQQGGWYRCTISAVAERRIRVHFEDMPGKPDAWVSKSADSVVARGVKATGGLGFPAAGPGATSGLLGRRRTSRKGAGAGVDRMVPEAPGEDPPRKRERNSSGSRGKDSGGGRGGGGGGGPKAAAAAAGGTSAAGKLIVGVREGTPPEITCAVARINLANYRLKVGLLNPPRIVIRDLIAMICGLTDTGTAVARGYHMRSLTPL